MDFEVMYQAMDSRDRRFDGRFFVAVKTTGIYCRPICPAPSPRRHNTVFYRYAAVAELAGFRPCRRCHPEASPDTAEWDTRKDLVGRGLRLIAEGVVDSHGVSGLARRLGVTDRHLQRLFKDEIGATPGVIARSRRARLARQLLTETDMPITRVAFTSGFSSVRAFNETMQQVYRVTPSELRRGNKAPLGSLQLELTFRPPLAASELLDSLARDAVPGVEHVTDSCFSRFIPFGRGDALIEVSPTSQSVSLRIKTDEVDSVAPVIQRCRQLMDLDADPYAINEHLGRFPLLKELVARRPGLRLIGSYDPFQAAVRVILGRGASDWTASAAAGRLAARLGRPVSRPTEHLTHFFPTPEQLIDADLTQEGISAKKAGAIRSMAAQLHDGSLSLDGSMDPGDASDALRAIPGIGDRTAEVIALRSLRDPDAFPVSATELSSRYRDVARKSTDQWRPWRGYAAMHLRLADLRGAA